MTEFSGAITASGRLSKAGMPELTLQNAVSDECLRVRTALQLLLKTIGAHMLLELSFLALERGCGAGVWKDVAYGNRVW